MKELAVKKARVLRMIFYACFIFPLFMKILFLTMLEGEASVVDEFMKYTMETITIISTLVIIPLALWGFQWLVEHRLNNLSTEKAIQTYGDWNVARMGLIIFPAVFSILANMLCASTIERFIVPICLIALIFCFPTQETILRHLKIND